MANFQITEVEKGRKYYLRVDLGKDAKGKRLRPNYTIKGTYQDAQQKGYELLRQHKENTLALPNRITVEQAIQAFNDDSKSRLSLRTHDEQVKRLNRYVIPEIGDMKLQGVSTYDVEKILLCMNDNDLSWNTQRLVRTNLNKFWKYARKRGWVIRNVIEDVEIPARNDSKQIEFIPPRKFKAFIRATKTLDNVLNEVILRTLVRTGMRLSEAMALTWADVDLDDDIIAVTRSSEWIDRVWLNKATPKNKSSRRSIPVEKKVSRDLILLRPAKYKFTDKVFQNELQEQSSYETLRDALARVLTEAELPQMGLHSLRHTYATYMLASGKMQMHEVSRLLGHSTIKVTVDTYGHIDFADLQEKVREVAMPNAPRFKRPKFNEFTQADLMDKNLDKTESN